MQLLYQRVAPNAILNSGGRADEVKCHPGTRTEVIGIIEQWMGATDCATRPIFWLNGPAGAGKTAILQTIAERSKVRGVPHANFFFFRTDPSRNSTSPFVATLIHQIFAFYPLLRDAAALTISTNPLILHATVQEQFSELLVAPLRVAQQSSPVYLPIVLIIDGLDECDSESKLGQRQILRALENVLVTKNCPFRVLVASRVEHQITTAFNQMSAPVFPLYLNDEYSPERDIRLFVIEQFRKVRATHPLRHTLEEDWPSIHDQENVVRKSSGQFIYAATVMRFISDSAASPKLSLERVNGAAQTASNLPFSHLDAIYTYILSRADDQEALKDILHAQCFLMTLNRGYRRALPLIINIYNGRYNYTFLHSCTADVAAIARLEKGELIFYHASLPDYLMDRSRSGAYFVDIDSFNDAILPALWAHAGKVVAGKHSYFTHVSASHTCLQYD
jgi:hypothetical protein